MTNRGTLLSAATALVAAVPVAAWGLLGQQNAAELPASQLDYAFQPLGLPDGLDTVLGAVALVLAGVGATLLVRASRSGGMDKRWWGVLAPLVMAGLLVGMGWRVLTAGVIGANIGAGLVIFFGGPVVAGLLLWALGRGVWLANHRPGGDNGPDGDTGPGGGNRPDGDTRGGHWTGFAPRGA
ncbi:hypothetical protein [Streptomyces sp. NBC_00038]|uniref:hypothetical protein n=1 Tax=Streptomyces sp. NBC_00038 TaxID=2903615 RepID=UPI002250ECC8|nr:hypothetical protein [Streptomyces sp. NBC_00038]MCX5558710.1 hypothetical protein [Streptomyces sp. NBC_00038]